MLMCYPCFTAGGDSVKNFLGVLFAYPASPEATWNKLTGIQTKMRIRFKKIELLSAIS
jgi:hypothetical protein